VWVGTDGAGLLELDKNTHKIVRYGENDGLMSDVIRTLCLADDTLWIGHGVKSRAGEYNLARQQGGGLGAFRLSEHRFRSFAPSLTAADDSFGSPQASRTQNGPTRRIVSSLAGGRSGEVWFAASRLRRFRIQENTWAAFPELGFCTRLASNSEQLVAGTFWNWNGVPQHGPPGLNILNYAQNNWTQVKDFGVLPSGVLTVLTMDGNELWFGGLGFIAKMSMLRNELRNYAYVRAYNLEQIQIGGGFVWAQYDGGLHRARLP
jgi:ligand-binding sensor domain-containing protein